MSEANKAVVRRFIEEVLDKGNLSVIDELVANDFVTHSPPPNVPPNKGGLKEAVLVWRSAFPDNRHTIEDIIAEGDKVALRLISHGTQNGALLSIPPTGRSMNMIEQHFVRLAGGKIAEHWGVEDNMGMFQQLGVIPKMM